MLTFASMKDQSTTLSGSGELMTVREAAERLKLSRDHVRRLIRQGTIKARRIGESGNLRIPAAELHRLAR